MTLKSVEVMNKVSVMVTKNINLENESRPDKMPNDIKRRASIRGSHFKL